MTLTPAALRLDKKCGRSGIADHKKCRKGTAPVASPEDGKKSESGLSTKTLLTVGGVAATTAVLGVLAHDVFIASGVPSSKVPPKKPPEGLYDSFRPGDLIYQTDSFAGANRAHYAVYVGKENGVHKVFDTAAKNKKGKQTSTMSVKSIEEATGQGTSFALASRVDENRRRPTTDELNKIITRLNNKSFDWTGFEANCETLARSVVNDLPVSTQSQKVSAMTSFMTKRLISVLAPKGYRARAVKQTNVQNLVSRVMSDELRHDEGSLDDRTMALTPTTVQQRLDKKCGASGIPDNAKCLKGTGQQVGYANGTDLKPLKSRHIRAIEKELISGEMLTGSRPSLSSTQYGILVNTRGTAAREGFKQSLRKASSSSIKEAVQRGKGSQDPYLRAARQLGKRELNRRSYSAFSTAWKIGNAVSGIYALGFNR